ncbi:G-protein coupled receptor moody-like [Pecten maximus]|uniref:G-protein coupled receptor moody-like n=1 Tax=Pecten maximus TaxID=6579 RepID=UPI001457F7A7|nr:G-protein coupled receptor moody-like [Pecten maximus]
MMNMSGNASCDEWWCDQRETLVVLEVVVILLCAIGSFGNLITVLAICSSSLRNNINCVLIGSLSFAGFLYCLLILSLQAVVFHLQDPHLIPPDFCSAAGGIRYTLVGVIMVHLSVIALYRYLNIVHLGQYKKASNTRPLILTLIFSWVLPLMFTVPPSFGIWGSFRFQPAVLACTFNNFNVDHSNRIVTVTLGFIVPCIFIVFCYARIGCVAYGSSKRVGQWKGTSAMTKALRLSAMMMCIFAIFFFGTFPYFIMNVYDRSFSKPVHHLWTTMLGWLSYCLNPVVYTVMDNNFRTAYRRLIMGDCEKSPLHRGPTTSSGTPV